MTKPTPADERRATARPAVPKELDDGSPWSMNLRAADLDGVSRVRLRSTVLRAIDRAFQTAGAARTGRPEAERPAGSVTMPAQQCRVPSTIRLVGRPGEDGWPRLEDALVRRYVAVLRQVEHGRGAGRRTARPQEPIRELYDQRSPRLGGYLIPSYDTGEPLAVPMNGAGGASTPDIVGYTVTELRQAIQAAFPSTGGVPAAGVFYGIYARTRDSDKPMLYYVRTGDGREQIHSVYLYVRIESQTGALRLEPGYYVLTFAAQSTGTLTRDGKPLYAGLENPENLDLTIQFVVKPHLVTRPDPPPWSFIPVMHIVARNIESPLGTGTESVYVAAVDIWRVDELWRPQLVDPLAFIGTFPHYHWEIHKLPREDDLSGQPELVREVDGHDAHAIRHTWKTPGRYEVKCWVTVRAADVAPLPVTDRRVEEVIEYYQKIALSLELLERQEAGKTKPTWATSARQLIKTFEDNLAAERAKQPRNETKVEYLVDVLEELREQLTPASRDTIGPFPVHALFAEQKTSHIQPVSLFLAFELTGDPVLPYRWYLTDVTYPPFYRTYHGEGRTVVEALLATFHDSEKSIRRTYPPGHILVRINKADLERYGIKALTGFTGRDFTFETDSFEKDAYEWLIRGVKVVGAAGLVAAFIFPPSVALMSVLVITGVAGATLSMANIADRVATKSFRWDVETFADLATIAGALAQVGSIAAGVRTTALSTALRSAEIVPSTVVAALGLAAKLQQALMVTQLGTDVANALILGAGTYQQLRMVDVEFDDESLKDYQRVYGIVEGRARWRQERQNRITGILVQAVTGVVLVAISVRSDIRGLGKPTGTAPHAPSQDEPPGPPASTRDPSIGRPTEIASPAEITPPRQSVREFLRRLTPAQIAQVEAEHPALVKVLQRYPKLELDDESVSELGKLFTSTRRSGATYQRIRSASGELTILVQLHKADSTELISLLRPTTGTGTRTPDFAVVTASGDSYYVEVTTPTLANRSQRSPARPEPGGTGARTAPPTDKTRPATRSEIKEAFVRKLNSPSQITEARPGVIIVNVQRVPREGPVLTAKQVADLESSIADKPYIRELLIAVPTTEGRTLLRLGTRDSGLGLAQGTL
jgi:hypothetical protein